MKAVRWIGAAALLVGFLVGVPVVFIAGPSPLDQDRGVWSLVDAVLDNTQVFEEAVLSLFVAIGWALWAYLAVSAVLEVVGIATGRVRAIRGFGLGRSLVGPVVSALMWSSTATTLLVSVSGAGTLALLTAEPAAAQVVEPESVEGDSGDDTVGQTATVLRVDNETVVVNGSLARPHLVVVEGDTMWALAEKHLGDPFRWTDIAALNLDVAQPYTPTVTDPDLIWPQTLLLMPADAVGVVVPPTEAIDALCDINTGAAATVEDSHVIVVEQGDTMWDVSEDLTGDPHNWPELAAENLGEPQPHTPTVTDPDLIWPDTQLTIPETWFAADATAPDGDLDPDCDDDDDDAAFTFHVNDIPAPNSGATTPAPEAEAVAPDDVEFVAADTAELVDEDSLWWLAVVGGVAAAVFAAAMIRLLARRRSRDQALGHGIEESSLEAIEALGPPDRDLREHLLAAASALADAVTTHDAAILQVDADKTTALFTEVVQPPATSKWTFTKEDGDLCAWSLDHNEVDRDRKDQVLFGLGDNLFINLEVVGWLCVKGDDDEVVSGLVRHLVHDLAVNAGQEHELLVRVGGPAVLEGTDVYGVVGSTTVEEMETEIEAMMRDVDDAHARAAASFHTSLIAELRDEKFEFPTLVYVVDLEQADRLEPLLAKLSASPGRYPIGVVSIGAATNAPWTARVVSRDEVILSSKYLTKAPRVRPELLSVGEALALSATLSGRTASSWTPTPVPEASRDATTTSDDAAEDPMVAKGRAMSAALGEPPLDDASAAVIAAETDDEDKHDDRDAHDEHDSEEATEDEVPTESSGGGAGTHAMVIDLDVVAEQGASTVSSGGLLGGKRDAFSAFENPIPGTRWDPPPDERPVINDRYTPASLASLTADGAGLSDVATEPVELIELTLLGVPKVLGEHEPSDAAVAMAALLGAHPEGLSRSQVKDAIWDGYDISDRRFRTVVNEVRKIYGPRLVSTGTFTLDVRTDVGVLEASLVRSQAQDWDVARAGIADAVNSCTFSEPLNGVSGRWWEWADREGSQCRRKLVERTENALWTAAQRALSERDWPLAQKLGAAGVKVSSVSERMTELVVQAALGAGDTAQAMEAVKVWEISFEEWFESGPPGRLRALVGDATHRAVAS